MKTSIVVVGFDLPFISKFAHKLATALGYRYIDMGEMLDRRLLENINLPLNLAVLSAEITEQQLFNKIADRDKVVATVSIKDYISNDNYTIFDNSYIILVTKNNEDKINTDNNILNQINLNKNIINFAKKHADLVLEQENLEINDILKKIKG